MRGIKVETNFRPRLRYNNNRMVSKNSFSVAFALSRKIVGGAISEWISDHDGVSKNAAVPINKLQSSTFLQYAYTSHLTQQPLNILLYVCIYMFTRRVFQRKNCIFRGATGKTVDGKPSRRRISSEVRNENLTFRKQSNVLRACVNGNWCSIGIRCHELSPKLVFSSL